MNAKISVFVICAEVIGSRTMAPEENCPPNPKLTLTQTLTFTNFPWKQLCGCPPTLKLTLTLIQIPTLIGGQFSSGGNCPDTDVIIYLLLHNLDDCIFNIKSE